MYRGFVWATFGWLTFSGTLHFLIDVVSQYVRGVREPSPRPVVPSSPVFV